jgi:hypothetical protein
MIFGKPYQAGCKRSGLAKILNKALVKCSEDVNMDIEEELETLMSINVSLQPLRP